MPNILFLSDNSLLQNDLCEQITLHLPDYNLFTQDDSNTVFDIALLDGKIWLNEFRANHSKVPALILEPSDSEEFSDNNLDIFVFKPLILPTLLSQIQSGIHLFENSSDGFLYFGEYELHPIDKEIVHTPSNQVIKLTEREVSIIQYLYKSQGKIVSKNDLLQDVWEYNPEITTHTIETHIYRLRKKIEQTSHSSQFISAEEGGYRLLF